MGVVYRGYDTVLETEVAVKTIRDDYLTNPRAIKLFRQECKKLASLVHGNIIEIRDAGEFVEAGVIRPFLVMPLLSGMTLGELIRRPGEKLTVARVVDIAMQSCRGLHAAHEAGVIHRDIKPSNIFVLNNESIKIIDFGVARTISGEASSMLQGTPMYMSPEQLDMKPLSARSDIFSLGATCYEALTRRWAFDGRGVEENRTDAEIIEAIRHGIPRAASEFNSELSESLSRVIHKAMAKQPSHRFSSAREFGEMLDRALHNEHLEIFDPARLRPRLDRAREAFGRGDLQFAEEIVEELEAEGNLSDEIGLLRREIRSETHRRKIRQLLDSARTRNDEGEYALALQKLDEALRLDPDNTEARALKGQIESRRTDERIEDWFRLANQHIQNSAYGRARDALENVLKLRPGDSEALQLLLTVDGQEQEYNRLREQKRRLYHEAVEARRRGEISTAVGKMERVIDLERRAPDVSSPDRAAGYQSFYNEVRTEHEAIRLAYAEANRLLSSERFQETLAICNEYLAKYPNHALFQDLRLTVDERQLQAVSRRIADVDRQVEAEPHMDRRVDILEQALREFPGEVHFELALQRARAKRALVESIVAQARGHEERGRPDEALAQWETLREIHRAYPGLDFEIQRVQKLRDDHRLREEKTRWVEQIARRLEAGDLAGAVDLSKKARDEFPEDAQVAELESQVRQAVDRDKQARGLLALGRDTWDQGRNSEALEIFRRAHRLDERNPGIRRALVEALVEQARVVVETDPASAEGYLQQALALDERHVLARDLLRQANEKRLGIQRRDLDEVKRIGQEAAKVSDLDSVMRYLGQIEAITKLYRGQEEFESEVKAVRHLAQTLASTSAPRDPAWVTQIRHALRAITGRTPVGRRWYWVAALAIGLAFVVGVLIRYRTTAKKLPPLVREGTVEITTSPSGAAIWVDDQPRGASSPVALKLPEGSHQVEARMPGYQTARAPVVVRANDTPGLSLSLIPASVSLRVFGSGRISVDTSPDVDIQGQFVQGMMPGRHTVRIKTGSNGEASFGFEAQLAGIPVVTYTSPPKDLTGFLVGNAGQEARILGLGNPVRLIIDGKSAGILDQRGIVWPGLLPGSHSLQSGEGRNLRKRSIDIGKEPVLIVYLEAQANLGILVLQTNENDAECTVVYRGQSLRKKTTDGVCRFSDLSAGEYKAQVNKQGFDAEPRSTRVQEGEEKILKFQLRPVVHYASAHIRATFGTQILLDGNDLGTIPAQGVLTASQLTLGSHELEARLKHYKNYKTAVHLREGDNDVAVPLERAPGVVRVSKTPASAWVVYSREGQRETRAFSGDSGELPEGSYLFTASAPGYLEKKTPVGVTAGETATVDLTLAPAVTKVEPPPVPKEQPPPSPNKEVLPTEKAAPPAQKAARSGRLIWTGTFPKNGVLTIEGRSASIGSVIVGELPAVAVNLSVLPAELSGQEITVYLPKNAERSPGTEEPNRQNGWNRVRYLVDASRSKDIAIAERPGGQNQGKRLVIRAGRPLSMIVVEWALQ